MNLRLPALYFVAAHISVVCHGFLPRTHSPTAMPLGLVHGRGGSVIAGPVARVSPGSALLVSQLDLPKEVETNKHEVRRESDLLLEFMNQKRLREALRQSKIFEGVRNVELEAIVQSCSTVTVTASADNAGNGILFHQGDIGDAMYIVQTGRIEIVQYGKQQGEEVLSTLESGGLFGELALFFDEPRAATARVARGEKKATVWRLSKDDYTALVSRNANIQSTALQAVVQDPTYVEYLDRRDLMETLKSCPIFRGFNKKDLQRCAESVEQVSFQDKEIVIQQGDRGDAMYFVKSGKVICSTGGTGKVLSEIGPGGYFGELALLFDKPRAANVQAFGDKTHLWKLSADMFASAVQDYPMADKTLELLQEQYQTKSVFSALRKSSIGEVTDVIRAASRPKKKNVSTHSVISTMYASMFLSAILPLFSPQLSNVHGSAQLFSMEHLSAATVQQFRLCSWLVILVSLMGQFRIPRNAPQSRKKFFTSLTVTSIAMLAFGDSNLAGATSNFTFNIMSKFGGAFLVLTSLASYGYMLGAIDDALVGTNRGRETVPLCTTRLSATLFYSAMCILMCIQLAQIICPIFDKVGYVKYALPFYQSGLQRLNLFGGAAITGMMAFGALFGTLRFEKKISSWQATLLNVVCVFAFISDQLTILFANPLLPRGQLMQASNLWMSSVSAQLRLNWVFLGPFAFTILNAFRRRVKLGVKD